MEKNERELLIQVNTMNQNQIKYILENIHFYGGRKLIIVKMDKNEYNYLFYLCGTPPKGYAIYIEKLKEMSVYNAHGKRVNKYSNLCLNLDDECDIMKGY